VRLIEELPEEELPEEEPIVETVAVDKVSQTFTIETSESSSQSVYLGLENEAQTDLIDTQNEETQTIPEPTLEIDTLFTQTNSFQFATSVETQTEPETQDAESQTEPVGAVYRWLRLVHLVRRVSFLRRTKYSLTEYVKGFDGIYARTGSSSSSSKWISSHVVPYSTSDATAIAEA
jgi:hypothetical protein